MKIKKRLKRIEKHLSKLATTIKGKGVQAQKIGDDVFADMVAFFINRYKQDIGL